MCTRGHIDGNQYAADSAARLGGCTTTCKLTTQFNTIPRQTLSIQRFPSPNPIRRAPPPAHSRRNVEVQPHPGNIRPYPRIRNPSAHPQLRRTWNEHSGSPGPHHPHKVWKPNPTWLIAVWLGFVESAPPGKDKAPSQYPIPFHTCTTSTNQGRQR